MQGGYQDISRHSLAEGKGHLSSSARLQVLLLFNFTVFLVTPVKNTTPTRSTPAVWLLSYKPYLNNSHSNARLEDGSERQSLKLGKCTDSISISMTIPKSSEFLLGCITGRSGHHKPGSSREVFLKHSNNLGSHTHGQREGLLFFVCLCVCFKRKKNSQPNPN